SGWDSTNTANDMTKGEDGVYSITYKDVQAQDISFKVVTNHDWNPSYGWGTGNYVIKVTEACDVTIKFDPATETITVEGENVEIMNFSPDVIETMYVTGNDANVYGEAWNSSTNKMTEVSKGVYEILFEDVEDGQLQAKFCVNGSWTFNFGAGETKEVEVGNSLELKLNGDNIIIDIQEPGKLTMQFDTTNMDAYGNGGVARFFFAAEEPVPAGE
uniref:pullulanase X25 domain-containing protein n=1 Tax=uncultured Ruminococcus sp. TaxID=165186 RepID=UPI00292DFB16